MKTTVHFLDALSRKYGDASDYRLAKIIGVRASAISGYRAGRSNFDDRVAIKVAELLEIDPMHVIASMHAVRAKHSDERQVWEGLARKMAGATAGVLVALVAVQIAQSPSEFTYALSGLLGVPADLWILCQIVVWLPVALALVGAARAWWRAHRRPRPVPAP
jgi:hypothetical protein